MGNDSVNQGLGAGWRRRDVEGDMAAYFPPSQMQARLRRLQTIPFAILRLGAKGF